jgi:hypothetical protein
VERQSIINPDWDFTRMGIGGLDTEFNAIFRQGFIIYRCCTAITCCVADSN